VRLVIDTNVLVSALLVGASLSAHLIELWREGRFDLLTSAEQLDELMRVTRYPKIRERLAPALAGRLINELRETAVPVKPLPVVTICDDPYDNYLLAMSAAGGADFLVTGDKRDLLSLKLYEGARIITVREFLTLNKRGYRNWSSSPRPIPITPVVAKYPNCFVFGVSWDDVGCGSSATIVFARAPLVTSATARWVGAFVRG
jgi:putative PIN family toxin of toxin-antitoxin system